MLDQHGQVAVELDEQLSGPILRFRWTKTPYLKVGIT